MGSDGHSERCTAPPSRAALAGRGDARVPDAVACVLRSHGNAREMRSEQPIERHAALHDDGEAAAGPQPPRCVGDEVFEQRVVLGEARMQRRIGEDRVPRARGAGEASREAEAPRPARSRGRPPRPRHRCRGDRARSQARGPAPRRRRCPSRSRSRARGSRPEAGAGPRAGGPYPRRRGRRRTRRGRRPRSAQRRRSRAMQRNAMPTKSRAASSCRPDGARHGPGRGRARPVSRPRRRAAPACPRPDGCPRRCRRRRRAGRPREGCRGTRAPPSPARPWPWAAAAAPRRTGPAGARPGQRRQPGRDAGAIP